MFHEGQSVTSIGDGSDGVPLGVQGRILMLASAAAGHVRWMDGPRAGEVSFYPELEDAVAPSPANARRASAESDLLEDSLEYGTISHTGARHELATGGPAAVLRMLASTGALAETGGLAEEAVSYVEGQLRQLGAVTQQIAELDPEDQFEVIRLASVSLLAESLGGYSD